VSIGEELAAARRQAGLTVTQVSQRTCIRETIVRGIERGDYSACGGDFYARGHIRNVARAVGLDPEDLIREYDATQAPPQEITAADVFQPFTPVKLKERRRPNWSVVLAIGVIAVAGVVGFRYFGSRDNRNPPRGQTTSSESNHHSAQKSSPPPTTPVSHPAPTHVHVKVVAHQGGVTWVRLTSAANHQIFQGDIGASAGILSRGWTRKGPITLMFGNPGGATLYLNGKKQPFSETTSPITVTCDLTACTTTLVS
jgi:transcriptional regulator with XRE-family HTH domain